MKIEELIDAIGDPACDAFELTRRALVLARSRADVLEVAANTDETITIAGRALRSFIEALDHETTIDLTPVLRTN